MTILGGGWKRRLALAALAAAILAPAVVLTARAQQLAGANNLDPARGAPALPPPPPQGAWGEVIMANAKWMVVQNHEGQQFPIAADAVRQFLIRWPTTLGELTNQSVIEAVGQDLGSNTLQTDHVDVFEGEDRGLVRPTFASLLPDNRLVTTIDPGFNRFMNGFDIGAQNLQFGWAYPVQPGALGIPARLHVVGNAISVNPLLRISVLGTNFATVVPADLDDPGSLVVTQVTQGDASYAEKGDVVFLMPTDLTARTVTLSQVVLYKKVAFKKFQAPQPR